MVCRLAIGVAVCLVAAACDSAETSSDSPDAKATSMPTNETAAKSEPSAGPTPAAMPTPASPTASADEVAFPIKTGFYTYPELDCAQAMGNPPRGITITKKYWRDIDGDYDLLPVRDLGNGRFRMGDYTIRVINENVFIADEGMETEVGLKWCTAKEL